MSVCLCAETRTHTHARGRKASCREEVKNANGGEEGRKGRERREKRQARRPGVIFAPGAPAPLQLRYWEATAEVREEVDVSLPLSCDSMFAARFHRINLLRHCNCFFCQGCLEIVIAKRKYDSGATEGQHEQFLVMFFIFLKNI